MYHFGIPEYVIHLGHLAMGAFFAYVGYYKKMNKQVATAMLVLGALAIAYHGHLVLISNEHFEGEESKDAKIDTKAIAKKEKKKPKGPGGCHCDDPACDC